MVCWEISGEEARLSIFLGGKKQQEQPKHGHAFSITNAVYFSFVGMLHNCNPENEATAVKGIRTQIKTTGANNILYNRHVSV